MTTTSRRRLCNLIFLLLHEAWHEEAGLHLRDTSSRALHFFTQHGNSFDIWDSTILRPTLFSRLAKEHDEAL